MHSNAGVVNVLDAEINYYHKKVHPSYRTYVPTRLPLSGQPFFFETA